MSDRITSKRPGRLRTGLKRHGKLGVLKLAGARALRLFYLREAHDWYELDLRKMPRVELPEGFRLVEAGERELPALDTLPTVKLGEGERRLGEGASLWLLMEGDRAAFACWTFYQRMPVPATRDGALVLPPRVAALEDSITAPDYRGRGLGGYALPQICHRLVGNGYQSLITKIAEDNEPSKRAAKRAGFEHIALMHTMRTAAKKRVAVEADESADGIGRHIAERLSS
jgi:GNAT superfamily N-acetyltransferase